MAKSIRSKIKRKHRAEFRSTIGNDAYQRNMSKVNNNLQQCIERQSMSDEAIEKLQGLLGSEDNDDDMDAQEVPDIDAAETMKPKMEVRGENRVAARQTPSKRSKRRKHKLDSHAMKVEKADKVVRKPRFFCQF